MSQKSADDLKLAFDMRVGEVATLSSGGYKQFFPDGSWLQLKQQDVFERQYSECLGHQRVVKQLSLIEGVWDAARKEVEVTKDLKNIHGTMGRYEEQRLWLRPEEALFLVDTGRLEIYYGGVPFTLHQCYTVLLQDTPLAHYRVYAYLSRLGYILQPYSKSTTAYERALGIGKKLTEKKKPRNSKKSLQTKDLQQKLDMPSDLQDAALIPVHNEANAMQTHAANEQLENTPSNGRNMDVCTAVADKLDTIQDSNTMHTDTNNQVLIDTVSTSINTCKPTHNDTLDGIHTADKVTNITTSDSSTGSFAALCACGDNDATHTTSCDMETSPAAVACRGWLLSLDKWSCAAAMACSKAKQARLDHSIVHDRYTAMCAIVQGAAAIPAQYDAVRTISVDSSKDCSWAEWRKQKDDEACREASVLWSGEVKPLIKPGQKKYNVAEVFRKLDVVQIEHLSKYNGKEHATPDANFDVLYDVYRPNKNFSKKCPGKPQYRVCLSKSVSSGSVTASDLQSAWQHSLDNVPLLWTVFSDGGEMNFCTFTDVTTPHPSKV